MHACVRACLRAHECACARACVRAYVMYLQYSGAPLIRPLLQHALSWPYKVGGLCLGGTSFSGPTLKAVIVLGVRSLANASRARQFNPLNLPGVGQIFF